MTDYEFSLLKNEFIKSEHEIEAVLKSIKQNQKDAKKNLDYLYEYYVGYEDGLKIFKTWLENVNRELEKIQ